MKNTLSFPCSSLMAKVVITKKDKASTKKLKEPKYLKKAPRKIQKLQFHKTKNNNASFTAKKKILKKQCASRKPSINKVSKLKYVKSKQNKLTKNSSLNIGRRKSLQKNHVLKNDVHIHPVKIPKMISKTSENECAVNGSHNASIAPHTKHNNSCASRVDAPTQPEKSLTNGIEKNGSLVSDMSSNSFIPQKKPVGAGKKSSAISNLKKKINVPKTLTHKHALKLSGRFHKVSARNGNSIPSSVKGAAKKLIDSKLKICKRLKQQRKPTTISKASTSKANNLTSKLKNKCQKKYSTKKYMNNKKLNLKPLVEKRRKALVKNVLLPKKQSNTSAKPPKTVNRKTKSTNNNDHSPTVSNCKALVVRDASKLHPQRMASLDAMAKMHVICSSDRRLPGEVSKLSPNSKEVDFNSQQNCKKVHVGLKKEVKEFKEHIIRSSVNCVKLEKSLSEKVQTFCSISEEKEETVIKRSRGRPKLKLEAKNQKKTKNSPERDFILQKKLKGQKTVAKKNSVTDKNSTKKLKAASDDKPKKEKKSDFVKTLKFKEKTKSEKKSKLKVKETIRMSKTCTYQSVTTVSSHEAVDSLVATCSRLGVTTNYETKKTVVRNEACEQKGSIGGLVDEFQEPFLQALEVPCSMPPQVSNCCSHFLHPQPQALIPVAHSKPSCNGYQETRKHNSCMQQCCNTSGFPVQQCNHQQSFPYHHHVPNEYSCCCSSSLIQPVCSPCMATREAKSCMTQRSHCHLNPSSPSFCSQNHNIPSIENERHHEQCHNVSSPSNFQNNWCLCCEPYPNSRCQSRVVCTQCSPPISAKKNSSLVPCDQTPLDLSMGSSSIQMRTQLSTLNHCKDHPPFQPSSHSCSHVNGTSNGNCGYSNKNCAPCWNHNSDFINKERTNIVPFYKDTASTNTLQPISPPVSHVSAENSCESDRQEVSLSCSNSSSKQDRMMSRAPASKKRKFAHGWSWEGEPVERMLALTNDSIPAPKKCYPAMRHREGDIIKERDCVLLKSGPKETDLPYVAKVAAFWENPEDGEMMMSLLWYYRPEHTEQGRKPGQMEDEVFASKHRDVNSVACIEDKCYVLTFNEYCRYRSNIALMETSITSKAGCTVPEGSEGYPRQDCLPKGCVSPDMIFFCRHVYDFRQKRILKNPT